VLDATERTLLSEGYGPFLWTVCTLFLSMFHSAVMSFFAAYGADTLHLQPKPTKRGC